MDLRIPNMRTSFSISVCIKNYVRYICFMLLRKRKIVTICSAFLSSVLEVPISLSVVSKKPHWLFNNFQMITYKAPKELKKWVLFHFRFFLLPLSRVPFLLLACGISWGLLCSNPAAVWWNLNWTVLLFIMSSSKRLPWDGIKGRCRQLTEITLLPGRSCQTTFSSCEQYTAENSMHILWLTLGDAVT